MKTELIFDEMSETIIATAAKLASESGTETINVRRILQELGITNRVFYNRSITSTRSCRSFTSA